MNNRKIQQKKYHPLTVMAHDLKAPLTAIVDLLFVIEKGYVTDIKKSKELVQRARVKAVGLVKMVDDILDYTLLCNEDNLKKEMVDLSEIIIESINNLEIFADKNGVSISPIDAPATPCCVCGNRTFLLRAFYNLIMNAIKYNRQGGNILISMIPFEHHKKIKIIVKDTGIGMDKDDLEQVFNMFHRGKRAVKNIDGSLGLGLSLVRQIICRHRGTIDVQSKLDYGTTVTILLPLTC